MEAVQTEAGGLGTGNCQGQWNSTLELLSPLIVSRNGSNVPEYLGNFLLVEETRFLCFESSLGRGLALHL